MHSQHLIYIIPQWDFYTVPGSLLPDMFRHKKTGRMPRFHSLYYSDFMN